MKYFKLDSKYEIRFNQIVLPVALGFQAHYLFAKLKLLVSSVYLLNEIQRHSDFYKIYSS